MTYSGPENAHALVRASVSAFLSGEMEMMHDILNTDVVSAEDMAACCFTLVGMLSGAITTRAADMDMEPLEYWRRIIGVSMGIIGF